MSTRARLEFTRSLSQHITLADRGSSGKLRVPLMKAPSHFGHFTLRVNRLYNEDKYAAAVIDVPRITTETTSSSQTSESSETSETSGTSSSSSSSNLSTSPSTSPSTLFSFAVFDGHGGDQCLTYLSNNLAREVEEATELVGPSDKPRDSLARQYAKNIGGYWKRWYKHRRENFKKMRKTAALLVGDPNPELNLRLIMSFLKADYDFFSQDDNSAGSTCTAAFFETLESEEPNGHYFQRGTVSKLTIAHVGDTKAILVDREGIAHAMTQPHHPSTPNEASRLRKYATNFFMTDLFGEERFIALANTRAFGDVKFKDMGVTAEPEITECVVGDAEAVHGALTTEEVRGLTVGGHGGDESFLVLVSDGVTGVLTDQEIADVVMLHYNLNGHGKSNPQKCAEEVVKFVEYVGGDDNATCLVVRLAGWGKWPLVDRTGELRQSRMDDYNPRSNKV